MQNLTNSFLSSFKIDTILSVHYFSCEDHLKGFSRGYDYLELIYVEKGEIEFLTSTGKTNLHKGDILFHNANIVYSISSLSGNASTVISAAFIMTSHAKHFFDNKVFRMDRKGELLLNDFILEAYNSYNNDIENYQKPHMIIVPAAAFGAELILRLQLELLLLHIIRKQTSENVSLSTHSAQAHELPKALSDEELFQRISSYLDDHITSRLTLEMICKDNLISQSKLQKLFKSQTGKGAIDYFIEQKVEVAKLLISEHMMNFTQISEHLGYSSVHFFSRQFKKVTGLTPSEFSESSQTIF